MKKLLEILQNFNNECLYVFSLTFIVSGAIILDCLSISITGVTLFTLGSFALIGAVVNTFFK